MPNKNDASLQCMRSRWWPAKRCNRYTCMCCLKTGMKSTAHVTAILYAFSLVWYIVIQYCAIVSMLIFGRGCLPVQIVGGSKYVTWRLTSFKASANITYTYPRSYYKPNFDQQVYPRSDMFLVHPCPAIFFQLQNHWPLLLYNKWIQDNANKYKNVFHILPLLQYLLAALLRFDDPPWQPWPCVVWWRCSWTQWGRRLNTKTPWGNFPIGPSLVPPINRY